MLKGLDRFVSGGTLPPAVQAEIVDGLYPKSFRIGTSILTSMVNGGVLATIMHSWLPLAWMAVALALCGVRTLDWLKYQRARDSHTPSEWARRFMVRILPFSIWWGATAATLLLSDDPLLMAVAVLATDAQGTGAVFHPAGDVDVRRRRPDPWRRDRLFDHLRRTHADRQLHRDHSRVLSFDRARHDGPA
jgi:hypothetical protein